MQIKRQSYDPHGFGIHANHIAGLCIAQRGKIAAVVVERHSCMDLRDGSKARLQCRRIIASNFDNRAEPRACAADQSSGRDD